MLLSFQNEESLVDIPLTYRDTVGRHPLKVLVFSENYKHNKMGITLNDFNSFITYINKYRLYALPQTSAEYPSSYYPSISYKLGSSFSSVLQTLETTISIDSQILPDSDLPLGYPRLLSTDQVLVIPTDTTIRFLVTSNDVIHSRALPSFGIKIDAVPGRINQVITKTPFFGST